MAKDTAKKNPAKKAPGARDGREDRLKAALKANMARRKAQMRGRAAGNDEADKDKE